MKCLYCNNNLEQSSFKGSAYHYCLNCKHQPSFKFKNSQLRSVDFFVTHNYKCWRILLDFEHKKTVVISPMPVGDVVFNVDYVADFNPENIHDKLKTLLVFS